MSGKHPLPTGDQAAMHAESVYVADQNTRSMETVVLRRYVTYLTFVAEDGAADPAQAEQVHNLHVAIQIAEGTIQMLADMGGMPLAVLNEGYELLFRDRVRAAGYAQQMRDQAAILAAETEQAEAGVVPTKDGDILDQVVLITDGIEGTFDVDAMTREFVERWGLVTVSSVDSDEFWALLGKHLIDPDADGCAQCGQSPCAHAQPIDTPSKEG